MHAFKLLISSKKMVIFVGGFLLIVIVLVSIFGNDRRVPEETLSVPNQHTRIQQLLEDAGYGPDLEVFDEMDLTGD
jgi:hypothetical protein